MKFSDTELLPGVVVSVDDPKMLGRIKVNVPTLFNSESMSVDGLPWVYPLTMIGYQGFSKLMTGSKVWVFKQKDNYKELCYIPMFELNQNTREIVSQYNEPEVLISRSAGDLSVLIYYTDQEGIQLKVGETFINIKPDSSIMIKAGNGQIDVKNGKVFLGNGEATESAVLGNTLQKLLSQLASDIKNLGTIAGGCYFTNHLVAPINTMYANLNSTQKNILCDYTTVN